MRASAQASLCPAMELIEGAGLAAAGLAAGAVNAVAGGGSLISFPALVAAGYPAKIANVTNTVALWPGYLGGSLGYRKELEPQRRRVALLAAPSVVGAIAGSAALLSTPADAFAAVVPFLILLAAVLMIFQERLGSLAATHHLHSVGDSDVPWVMYGAMFLLAVYGAYFGAGLGILTLAALGILMPADLQRSNALKGMTSLLINAVAVVYFVLFGPVEWGPAALMAGAALAGGLAGAGIARSVDPGWLRWGVISYAIVAAVVLLVS